MSWALMAAAVLGLRHAMAPDHVAAVSTLTEKTSQSHRGGLSCALRIAGGHSVGMLLVAGLVIGLLASLPPIWLQWTTWGSGAWLLLIGGWMLLDLVRDCRRQSAAKAPASMPSLTWLPSYRPHASSNWISRPLAAWLVGLLFGIAVSPGDLAIFTLMLGPHASFIGSLSLLLVFLLAMFLGLACLGTGLGFVNTRAHPRRIFQAASGCAGIGVALALLMGYLH